MYVYQGALAQRWLTPKHDACSLFAWPGQQRHHLPAHYTFDFADAPIECGPGLGLDVGDVYPGPYYCFFEAYTPERMDAAIEHVREIIEEDGPYDAIFAFSQVCYPWRYNDARLTVLRALR
jgi:hypothetical protein